MYRLLFGLCVCLALCACGRSTPTSYYMLESAAEAGASGDLPKTSLRVAPVSLPQYLNHTGLVRPGAQTVHLTVDDSHQWAEPLSEGIRRVVQAELAGPLRQMGVHVQANADDSDSDYTLFVHVERLDTGKGGEVVLVAQWRCEQGRKVLAQGVFSGSGKIPGETAVALVQAQSSLVRQMAQWILEHLPKLG